MKKRLLCCLLPFLSMLSMADSLPSIHEGNQIKVKGFECIKGTEHVIDYLGRGGMENFPQFLVTDIENELNRQAKGHQLLSVECLSEPRLEAAKALKGETNALSKLSMLFPLRIVVQDDLVQNYVAVDQIYLVENLDDPEKIKLTQNFVVRRM